MSIEPSIYRIELISLRIKVLFYGFIAFIFTLGLIISWVLFSNNLITFFLLTPFLFLLALLLVSVLYVIKNYPDGTGSKFLKHYFGSIMILVLILGSASWIYFIQKSPVVLLVLAFPFLLYLTGIIIASLIVVSETYILFDNQSNELIYVKNFWTKVERKTLNMEDVEQITFGTKNVKELGPGSTNLHFTLKNNDFNSVDIHWALQTFNPPELCFKLIQIFSTYPIKVTINSRIYLRPFKNFFNRPMAQTQADFGYPDNERVKAIFHNCTNPNYEDFTATNSYLFSEQSMLAPFEVETTKVRSENIFVTILFSVIFAFTVFLIFTVALSLVDLIFQQNLLTTYLNLSSEPPIDRLVQLIAYGIILSLVGIFLFGLTMFGKESLLFQHNTINYSIKAFNRRFFSRSINKKAVIGIECSNKKVTLRLLGGDRITYWKGKEDERIEALRRLASLLV